MSNPSSVVPYPSTIKSDSFRLILYLEWILLGIMLLLQIRPARFGINLTSLSFSILYLIAFGLMGLKLPTQKLSNKLAYTFLEFGLLFLTFLVDHRTGFFPMFGLIIVIRACLMFQQAGRLIITSWVFISFVLIQFLGLSAPTRPHQRPLPIPESVANTILTLKLNTVVTFGLTLLFMLLLVNALLAERESREKLLKANDQLRQYALRIEDQATLQERNRIAREIHDSLGHSLTAQSIQLENALLFLPSNAEKSGAFLREAKQLGSRALQEVRRSISTLRSNPLQGKSLQETITKTVNDFRNTTSIDIECNIELFQPISIEISTALYRIFQESLTNIYKHSDATAVKIDLHNTPEAIYLQINDNGKGFDPNVNSTGFGLQGMRERTIALGGQFFLESKVRKGCQIIVIIPLPRLEL